ncbi:MAG TPA: FAD-dependent monooxygenase [Pseudonocardiaceae bacterium]|nr:FAD-dependent monooxygenase [Pseudonocardiaceae bacterium]
MSRVIIAGGSIVGLGAALALADRGHQVEILERSPDTPPDTVDTAAKWLRPTVPQAVQSHAFASLGCNLLRDRAPDVYDGLLAAGASEVNLADYAPPTLSEFRGDPSDSDLRMVLSRRSTFELVLRQRALARPGVSMSSGSTIRGLVLDRTDHRRVRGVRLADGKTRAADLVVDATGRRSAAEAWLSEARLPAPGVVSESCRIAYYTRHYRMMSEVPAGPLNRGFGAGGLWDHYTAVLFLCDNRSFTISLGVLPEDSQLKVLRHESAFTAAVTATPLLAGWLAPEISEPTSPVYSMGSLDNSLRLSTEDAPQIKGFYGLGDAICTTNPSYGRGVSLGLRHAFLLADLLDEHSEIDDAQAREFTRRTDQLVRPWWKEAVANDRERAAMWEATLQSRPPQRPPSGKVTFGLAVAASTRDEEVWRRVANVMMMLKPPSALYGDDEVRDRVGRALSAGPPPQLPGANRADLLDAVTVTTTRNRRST